MSAAAPGRLTGLYARSVYLPATIASLAYRRVGRRLRGVTRGQPTRLPVSGWRDVFAGKPIRLAHAQRNQGDVNLAELAVLATAAASVTSGEEIVEIGTFDGRTTLNLAINSEPHLSVFTLDLPSQATPKFALAPGERAFVDKPRSGRYFAEPQPEWAAACAAHHASFTGIHRRSTSRLIMAAPGSCSSMARTPTSMSSPTARPRGRWSRRTASCSGMTTVCGRA